MARPPAFLWMELSAIDPAGPDGGWQSGPIVNLCDQVVFLGDIHGVTVDEVEVGSRSNPTKERITGVLDRVPTDMGNTFGAAEIGKVPDRSPDQAKPLGGAFGASPFVAKVSQELHPDADAQQICLSAGDPIAKHIDPTSLVQVVHGGCEVADTRQDGGTIIGKP